MLQVGKKIVQSVEGGAVRGSQILYCGDSVSKFALKFKRGKRNWSCSDFRNTDRVQA